MPKEFYTEKDIEDLYKRGTRSLRLSENVVLTELAYEKANRLGVELLSEAVDSPPGAPVRPYISEAQTQTPKSTIGPTSAGIESQPALSFSPASPESPASSPLIQKQPDIEQRIRSAVVARLGDQVDAQLLDSIVHRVVHSVGLK